MKYFNSYKDILHDFFIELSSYDVEYGTYYFHIGWYIEHIYYYDKNRVEHDIFIKE